MNKLLELINQAEFVTLAKAQIPSKDAIEFINYYREGLGKNDLRSVWLDSEIVKFIIKLVTGTDVNIGSISGIRMYLAKYKAGVGDTQTDNIYAPYYADTQTAILALTTRTAGGDIDLADAYFDYGKPCPPYCNLGDIGSK